MRVAFELVEQNIQSIFEALITTSNSFMIESYIQEYREFILACGWEMKDYENRLLQEVNSEFERLYDKATRRSASKHEAYHDGFAKMFSTNVQRYSN